MLNFFSGGMTLRKECKSVKTKTHKTIRGEVVRGMVISWDIALC